MKIILPWPTLRDSSAKLLALFALSLISFTAWAQKPPKGTLVITFSDIRSDIGLLRAGVYVSEKEWIYHPSYSYKWEKKALKDGKLVVEVKDLPYGTYAISVLDDEDKSNSMNYTLKLPMEGWGMSTNPSFFKLKAPDFEECKFELDCPTIWMEVELNYLNKRKKIK